MTLSLLLIEDDDNDAALFTRACQSHGGIAVARASTQRAAVAALEAGTFDVIVLDMHLPNGEGIALYEAISDAARGTFIVVLTGASVPHVENAIVTRGSPVLHKSADYGGILNAVLNTWQRYGVTPVIEAWTAELAEARNGVRRAVGQEKDVSADVRAMADTADQLCAVIRQCGGGHGDDGH